MRIFQFSDSDVFAGTERHILELACGLTALGCPPVIACPMHGELARRAAASGASVIPVANGGTIDWQAALWLRKAFRQDEFNLVHVHNGRTALIGAVAIRMAGVGRMVATQHFIEPSRLRRRGAARMAASRLHRFVERRVDRFIAISHAVRDAMVARGDAAPDRIAVVHNGIDFPDRSALPPPEQVRRKLGVAAEQYLIVSAARLESEKNVLTLIEAMAYVRANCPQAICVIAGDGSQRHRLEGRIRELGLERNVKLLGFRADVLEIIAAADLFVLPSLAEPFGLVILEAMALGKAVVATAAGGPLEIVADGKTGLLVPPAAPSKLAEAIIELLRDDDRRSRMGLAGRDRFAGHFTARKMAAATLAVYRDVWADEPCSARRLSAAQRPPAPAEARSNGGR